MKNEKIDYNFVGMLIISILLIAGICILVFTGATKINDYNTFMKYLFKHGFEAIYANIFIILGLICWYNFICDVIITPKNKTLYLNRNSSNFCIFFDKKGKKYTYETNQPIAENRFYDVVKTKNIIKNIIGESNNTFKIPKEKIGYWLNFYTPMGNFENLLILPIIYAFFLPFFLSFIVSTGKDKLYGGIFMIFPLLFLIYDFIYKMKLKQGVKNVKYEMEFIKKIIENIIYKAPYIFAIIMLSIANIFLIKSFFNFNSLTEKLVIIPFILCILIAVLQCIFLMLKKEKVVIILIKFYAIVFLLYWFGFLCFITSYFIKILEYRYILFTIPFWFIGFIILYKYLLKK